MTKVAKLVDLVTDPKGLTRRQRHAVSYLRIRQDSRAVMQSVILRTLGLRAGRLRAYCVGGDPRGRPSEGGHKARPEFRVCVVESTGQE